MGHCPETIQNVVVTKFATAAAAAIAFSVNPGLADFQHSMPRLSIASIDATVLDFRQAIK